MSLLALAVTGRGLVDPDMPVLHADDEALLRGRAAFETMRVYGGRPFRLEAHLDRLEASSARIGLAPIPWDALAALGEEALAAAHEPDAVLRLLWTAGREDGAPVGMALVSPIGSWIEEARERGIRLVSLLGARAEVPWLLGGVKSTSYAVNMAAEAEAKRRGADDAIFVDHDRTVLEGPVSNVWWRVGTTLYTPSLDLGILAGVTRAVLAELAPQLGYEVEEGTYPVDALAAADEAFTSSSVREVLPIVEVDGTPVARGDAAPALQSALREVAAA